MSDSVSSGFIYDKDWDVECLESKLNNGYSDDQVVEEFGFIFELENEYE